MKNCLQLSPLPKLTPRLLNRRCRLQFLSENEEWKNEGREANLNQRLGKISNDPMFYAFSLS